MCVCVSFHCSGLAIIRNVISLNVGLGLGLELGLRLEFGLELFNVHVYMHFLTFSVVLINSEVLTSHLFYVSYLWSTCDIFQDRFMCVFKWLLLPLICVFV